MQRLYCGQRMLSNSSPLIRPAAGASASSSRGFRTLGASEGSSVRIDKGSLR